MNRQTVKWTGEDSLTWSAQLGIDNGVPCIFDLGYESDGRYYQLASNLHPQFKVITGVRTKINPQREKGLAPGEVLDYQWDTYSDDPMSRKDQVAEANSAFETTAFTYDRDGGVQAVTFNGVTIGKFSGDFR